MAVGGKDGFKSAARSTTVPSSVLASIHFARRTNVRRQQNRSDANEKARLPQRPLPANNWHRDHFKHCGTASLPSRHPIFRQRRKTKRPLALEVMSPSQLLSVFAILYHSKVQMTRARLSVVGERIEGTSRLVIMKRVPDRVTHEYFT